MCNPMGNKFGNYSYNSFWKKCNLSTPTISEGHISGH